VTWRRAAGGAIVLAVLTLAVLGLVRAASPAGTPTMRERVDEVAATLRCPTCQGLSIEDSTSVLAAGSRRIIQQQLQQGRTPDEIRQWFVDRYGSSVLLSPDPDGAGLVAWVVPGLVLVAGGLLVWRWLRHDAEPAADSDEAVDQAVAALAAWRDGALDPDDSPAGESLREALVAAEPDADEVALARVAAAYRRYTARPAVAAAPIAPRRPGRTLPRRAVPVGAAGVVLVAAGVGVALAVDRAAVDRGAGAEAATANTAAAPSGGAAPSPPAGWTGGMPQTPEEWVQLGHAYDADQQPAQAVAAYSMALQLQPDAESVLLLRADVLVRSGQADQALPDLQQLDARHPDTPQVLLVLGLAQNATGAPEAPATLRRFLELDPGSPAAAGVRKLLDGG
jgi:cytochrome c-type biogenesis protein CcmH